jgi:hypothetical protein
MLASRRTRVYTRLPLLCPLTTQDLPIGPGNAIAFSRLRFPSGQLAKRLKSLVIGNYIPRMPRSIDRRSLTYYLDVWCSDRNFGCTTASLP